MWPFRKKLLTGWVPPNPNEFEHTPDHIWLARHDFCLLFVYDETMLGRRLYSKLIGQDSVFLATAFTERTDWSLWKKKLGTESFPIALEGVDHVFTGPGISSQRIVTLPPTDIGRGILGRIKGELHAVRPQRFWGGLDKHYNNRLEFKRQRVKVLVPYRYNEMADKFVQPVRCWMYVGIKDYWCPQLDSGLMYAPVGAYKPHVDWADGHKIGEYFSYTRLEDATNF